VKIVAGEGNRNHPVRFSNFLQNTPKTAYSLKVIEVDGLGQQEATSHQDAQTRRKTVSNCRMAVK